MIRFKPVWSDSLGAKSYSIFIPIAGYNILIDPGVAIMHGSYPASRSLKLRWRDEAYSKIREFMEKSDIVIITHYHHDHYLWKRDDIELYAGKRLFIKDPNCYINDRQRDRALEFIKNIVEEVLNDSIDRYLVKPPNKMKFKDYVESYKEALNIDLGDYNERRRELLEKGREWFKKRVENWLKIMWIKEISTKELSISFADCKEIMLNDLRIRFTKPLYHGIEYARTGWVFSIIIEYANDKLIYTSDLQGPTIEDYASWIVRENPRILILDGPPTYLIPYMLNMYNFRRCVNNVIRIIEETKDLRLVIYDHHLTRDPKYKDRVSTIYKVARDRGVEITTVAEYLGLTPALELIKKG